MLLQDCQLLEAYTMIVAAGSVELADEVGWPAAG
jgi:hypothetical protein